MENSFVSKLTRLAELTIDDVRALESATARPRRYAARQDLIREGDEPGPVFVMMEGWACRYKILPSGTRQVMAFLMPGDACDLHIKLLAAMDHGIQTITAAHVATISREVMERMMYAHPNIARAMYTAQLIDEGIMRAWIVSMGRRTSTERVAHLICELYLRARNIGLTERGIRLARVAADPRRCAGHDGGSHQPGLEGATTGGRDGAQSGQRRDPRPATAGPDSRLR